MAVIELVAVIRINAVSWWLLLELMRLIELVAVIRINAVNRVGGCY